MNFVKYLKFLMRMEFLDYISMVYSAMTLIASHISRLFGRIWLINWKTFAIKHLSGELKMLLKILTPLEAKNQSLLCHEAQLYKRKEFRLHL